MVVLVLQSLLVVLVFGPLDVLGLGSETDRLSTSLVQRITAPFYRRWTDGPVRPASPVAVVEIDEAYLRHLRTPWPPDYATYAHLLHRIARQQPRAIFLDLLFAQDRQDDAGLALLVARIAAAGAAGIPVFVAAPHPCMETVPQARQEAARVPGRGLLREVAAAARPVVVEWSGFRDAYPLVLDPAERRGPAVTEPPCGGAGGGVWRTPALALFEEWCSGRDARACRWQGTSRPAQEVFAAPMAVQWGVEADVASARFAALDACGLVAPTDAQRLRWAAWALGRQAERGLRGLGPESFEGCPHAPTMSAAALYPADSSGELVADPEYEGALRDWFRDRLVLVGAALLGTGDVVRSPVHGRLPGVHLHAMALDNLLAYGERYVVEASDPRAPARPVLDALWAALAVGVMIAFGVVVARAEVAIDGAGIAARVLVLAETIVVLLAIAVAGLLLVLGISLATDTSIPNWLGIFGGASFSLPELTARVLHPATASEAAEAPSRAAFPAEDTAEGGHR